MRISFFFLPFLAISTALFSQNYEWKNVAIGGGGYALQTSVHPTRATGLFLASDVAGLFRWEAGAWKCLNDWNGPDSSHLYGCDGFALDKNNPATIFAAFGKYACQTGGIFKSTNTGDTWTRVRATRVGSNQNLREVQTSIAVDPNNSDVIYCGTRTEGLLRSTDGGTSWATVSDVFAGNTGDAGTCYWGGNAIGIRGVEIDGTSILSGKSAKIYVSVYETGIFRSIDGGATFSLMSGSPVFVNRISAWSSGIFATADDGVFKFDGTNWTTVTPPNAVSNHFNALQIDPNNSAKIVCSTGNYAFNQEVFRSINGGASWSKVAASNGQAVPTFAVPWFPTNHFMSSTASLTFDPHVSGRVYMTDWYSVWRTENIFASPVAWAQQNNGYECVVVLALAAPPSGAPLFSGIADVVGFRHSNTATFPPAKLFGASESTAIDFQEQNPQNMAAIVSDDWNGANTRLIKSTNGGTSWSPIAVPTGKVNGKIAISASDPSKMVYLPAQSAPFFTTNGGSTWQTPSGAPSGSIQTSSIFQTQNPLVADRMVANQFFLFDESAGKMYKSSDGGANWSATNAVSLPNGYNYDNFCNVSTGFNAASAGHLWVSIGENGLFRSTNSGTTFVQIPVFEHALLSALGKPLAGATLPTVYVYGKIAGDWGIFRSSDNGANWLKINDASTIFGDVPMAMTADRQNAGRIFVGSNGRGIWQGTDLAALPVENIDFFGATQATQNALFWTTASEQNNDFFSIERAENDGLFFEEIGKIRGHGYSNKTTNYQFFDEKPLEKAYYRFKQVDFDGKTSFSKIIFLKRKAIEQLEILPNPASAALYFFIKNEQIERAEIIAPDGRLVQFLDGFDLTKMEVESLPRGLYFLKIFLGNGRIEQARFLKK